jgi:transcriptional regulator with XRE-family HTH domain
MAKKKTHTYNRIRVILADKEKTNKWLAEKINKDRVTISRYVNNESQPSIQTLFKIADVLQVDVTDLLEKNDYIKNKK